MTNYECPKCKGKYGLMKTHKEITCPWCGDRIPVMLAKAKPKVSRSAIKTMAEAEKPKRSKPKKAGIA